MRRLSPATIGFRVPINLASALGLSILLVCTAQADVELPAKANISVERHFTTNALGSDLAVSDWYTLLRGALLREWGDKDAYVTLGAELRATRHDRMAIEDDRALAFTAQAFRRLRPGLELRGTLAYGLSSDGDHLALGPLTIGRRALKQTFGIQGQLGIDLGNATSLIIEAGDSFEHVGRTRFQHGMLPSIQMDPNRNRLQAGFRLARTIENLTIGTSGSAMVVTVQSLGTPPVAVGFARYGLRGELSWTGTDGSTLGVTAGAELLDAENGLYRRIKPSWQITLRKPLPHDLEVKGTYFARFEDVDTDDPLASWLHRAEMEAAVKIGAKLGLSAGLFWQEKENLLFENKEKGRGIYAEANYQLTETMTAVLRLDASRIFRTVLDTREDTVDVFVGWRASL